MTPRTWMIAAMVLAWCALVAVSIRAFIIHEVTAGVAGDAPRVWPRESKLPRAPFGATVLMFVHPDCPCTRASLAELSIVASTAPATARIAIVMEPVETNREPIRLARAVTIVDDGSEAARFGALTSGHVVVYDARGELVFSGGITGSRGHFGDNIGVETVVALVHGEPAPHRDHAVYGCALPEAR